MMFKTVRSERHFGGPDALPGPWELAWEAEHLEGASPQRILEWAVETYGDRLALSASFGGPEGMALIDMVSKITDEVTVLTIDTGFLFKETTEFREEFMRRYKLPLEVLRPKLTIEEQVEKYGERMRTCNPDICRAPALHRIAGRLSGGVLTRPAKAESNSRDIVYAHVARILRTF